MSVLKNLVDLVLVRLSAGIWSDADIEAALSLSLSAFNMVPSITYFTFEDEENIDQLKDVLVTYACYILLINQSIKQTTKEFTVKDSGVGFFPSNLAKHQLAIATTLWNNWDSQVNNIKQSESFYDDFINVQ